MIWRRRTVIGLLLVAGVLGAGCGMPVPQGAGRPVPRGPGGEGPGGRQQPLALNPKQELMVGHRAYQEVSNEVRGRLLSSGDPKVRRVRAVLARLVKATQIEILQREILLRMRGYRFEWEVNVVRDPQVNAFCLPGGKIFVFTGILRVTGDDDAFIATVMSHEMAHALAHHASERVAREQRNGKSVLRSLYYDRMQESEADHIGVFLMAFAGYDPGKAVKFWEKMEQEKGAKGGRPEFLSDHPSHHTRIAQMQKWAPRAREAKKAFDAGRIAPAGR